MKDSIVYISGWAEAENSFDQLWNQDNYLKKFAPCSYSENQSPKFPSYYAREISKNIKEQSVIIAWSLGGMIAQEIAAINPHLISKLILINSTGCFVKKENYPFGAKISLLRSMKKGLKKNINQTLKNFISSVYKTTNEDFISFKLRTIDKFQLENLLYGLDYFLNMDLRGLEYEINFPIYILHSKEDQIIPPESSYFLFLGYKEKKIIEIDSDNHAIYANNQLKEIINKIIHDQ